MSTPQTQSKNVQIFLNITYYSENIWNLSFKFS